MFVGLFSVTSASAQGYEDVDYDVFHEKLENIHNIHGISFNVRRIVQRNFSFCPRV
jgi:hypothetical protein